MGVIVMPLVSEQVADSACSGGPCRRKAERMRPFRPLKPKFAVRRSRSVRLPGGARGICILLMTCLCGERPPVTGVSFAQGGPGGVGAQLKPLLQRGLRGNGDLDGKATSIQGSLHEAFSSYRCLWDVFVYADNARASSIFLTTPGALQGAALIRPPGETGLAVETASETSTGVMQVAAVIFQPESHDYMPPRLQTIREYGQSCVRWMEHCIGLTSPVDLTEAAKCMLYVSALESRKYGRLRAALVVRHDEYSLALDGGMIKVSSNGEVVRGDQIDYLEGYVLPPATAWVL